MDNKSPEAFRTISEVADWLGVPTHVLRFWESRFAQVKPVKRAGGRRYYRPADMELLGGIRKLLHEDGMTIRGVQKLLREKGVKHVAALSPPIDQPVDMREVGGTNVVDLVDRRESAGAEDEIEDAVEVFDTQPFPPEDAAEGEAADGAERVEAAAKSVFADGAPEPTEPDAAAEAAEASEAVDEETAGEAPEDMADLPVPTIDPLSAPEAMDFLAHEAGPETDEEGFDTDAPAAGVAEADEVTADEAEDFDPFAGPEGLDFLAHEAEPETDEEVFDTGDEPEEATAAEDDMNAVGAEPSDVEETAAADASDATVEIESAEPETVDAAESSPPSQPAKERPPLALPELVPEPDDDADLGLPLATAIRLRQHRAARKTGVNVAALQALADRLDTLSGRLGQTPDRRRPF